jgi:hypothetical protein
MARKKPPIAILPSDVVNGKYAGATDPHVGKPQTLAQVAENIADTRASGEGVSRVPLDSRNLITVLPDWPIWKGTVSKKALDATGAIVRIRPPPEATDEDVERVRALMLMKGAERVGVLPRPRAELVPAAVAEAARGKAYGARQAVLSLVEESNSKAREALSALCEKIMAEVGL